jgi:hypothetical protein
VDEKILPKHFKRLCRVTKLKSCIKVRKLLLAGAGCVEIFTR